MRVTHGSTRAPVSRVSRESASSAGRTPSCREIARWLPKRVRPERRSASNKGILLIRVAPRHVDLAGEAGAARVESHEVAAQAAPAAVAASPTDVIMISGINRASTHDRKAYRNQTQAT